MWLSCLCVQKWPWSREGHHEQAPSEGGSVAVGLGSSSSAVQFGDLTHSTYLYSAVALSLHLTNKPQLFLALLTRPKSPPPRQCTSRARKSNPTAPGNETGLNTCPRPPPLASPSPAGPGGPAEAPRGRGSLVGPGAPEGR